jgi:hypothetical protein
LGYDEEKMSAAQNGLLDAIVQEVSRGARAGEEPTVASHVKELAEAFRQLTARQV